jgi:hypothetical protein
MMTGSVDLVDNKDAEDVLLIQEVLTYCDQRMGTETGILFQLLKVRGGTWESMVPNIELLAMSSLSTQKSFGNRPYATCRNYRNFLPLGRGVYHQRIQHIQTKIN